MVDDSHTTALGALEGAIKSVTSDHILAQFQACEGDWMGEYEFRHLFNAWAYLKTNCDAEPAPQPTMVQANENLPEAAIDDDFEMKLDPDAFMYNSEDDSTQQLLCVTPQFVEQIHEENALPGADDLSCATSHIAEEIRVDLPSVNQPIIQPRPGQFDDVIVSPSTSCGRTSSPQSKSSWLKDFLVRKLNESKIPLKRKPKTVRTSILSSNKNISQKQDQADKRRQAEERRKEIKIKRMEKQKMKALKKKAVPKKKKGKHSSGYMDVTDTSEEDENNSEEIDAFYAQPSKRRVPSASDNSV